MTYEWGLCSVKFSCQCSCFDHHHRNFSSHQVHDLARSVNSYVTMFETINISPIWQANYGIVFYRIGNSQLRV